MSDNKQVLYRTLAIPNRLHTSQEIIEIANSAYWHGEENRATFDKSLMMFTFLLRDILQITAISPPHKLVEHLSKLSSQWAGDPDIKHLAAEITKRYDILSSTFAQLYGMPLSGIEKSPFHDARTVREALLHYSQSGDPSMLCSDEVLDIAETVIHWQVPEGIGRPEGVSALTMWLGERLVHYRGQYSRGWWRAGLQVYRELLESSRHNWRVEHQEAFDILKNYVQEDGKCCEDKAGLSKYCSKVAQKYKRESKKD